MNKTYSEKLKDPKWQKKRLEIMQRDNFACQYCGDDKTTLNVHHFKYCSDPWLAKDDDLITLCEDCHEIIEILKSAQTTKAKDIKIIKHIDDDDTSSKMIAVFNSKKDLFIIKNKLGLASIFNVNDDLISKFKQIISAYKSNQI